MHQLHDFNLWKNLSWKNILYYSTEEVLHYNENGLGISDKVNNKNFANFNHHQHEYNWIYRTFFENINTMTIVDRFKNIVNLNFRSTTKKSKDFREYVMMKIYLSHPNPRVRYYGYQMYISQLENKRIKVQALNQILGLDSSKMDILDFN